MKCYCRLSIAVLVIKSKAYFCEIISNQYTIHLFCLLGCLNWGISFTN